jgi:hypothetical protein
VLRHASGYGSSVPATEETVDEYLPDLGRELRPTASRLIEVVLGAIPDAEHERKWGRLTVTRDGDWHHWICAISATKKEVKLHIHKGALLANPGGVMKGDGQYIRAISFRTPGEIDAEIIAGILKDAAVRQTEM